MIFHLQIQAAFLQPVCLTGKPFYTVAVNCFFKTFGANANATLQTDFYCREFIFLEQVKYTVWKQPKPLPFAENLLYQLAAF